MRQLQIDPRVRKGDEELMERVLQKCSHPCGREAAPAQAPSFLRKRESKRACLVRLHPECASRVHKRNERMAKALPATERGRIGSVCFLSPRRRESIFQDGSQKKRHEPRQGAAPSLLWPSTVNHKPTRKLLRVLPIQRVLIESRCL